MLFSLIQFNKELAYHALNRNEIKREKEKNITEAD
jgi:hypothetical protein